MNPGPDLDPDLGPDLDPDPGPDLDLDPKFRKPNIPKTPHSEVIDQGVPANSMYIEIPE